MKEVWGGETHVCSEADAKNVSNSFCFLPLDAEE